MDVGFIVFQGKTYTLANGKAVIVTEREPELANDSIWSFMWDTNPVPDDDHDGWDESLFANQEGDDPIVSWTDCFGKSGL